MERELKNSWPDVQILSIIADIQDKEKIQSVFNKFHPQIVFHAAAYKHVPLMEKEPEEAVKNNIFGAEIVAKAALSCNTENFVFISTDKAVNPSSIMGATKRIGEMICQNLNQKGKTKFVSVRFGNVLGSRGSVIITFKEQIKKGGPIEVTHEKMKRYFMIIPEAVSLVLQAGQMGNGGEVFVLDMGDPVKILDLAKELIKLSGLEPDKDIPIVFSSPRPGEKFFENILTAEEGVTATKNDKIFIARSSAVGEIKLNEELQKLRIFVGQNEIGRAHV
jgi:FlaA1/EpsC-like NDP-sugar epimerase